VAPLERILVADDESKIRSFVGRALNAAGYDTDFADDGAMALRVPRHDCDHGSNVIDACIRRLRSKLGFDLIKTVRGEGYQLVAR
jgi:DNA-binding response OmpR family regulator